MSAAAMGRALRALNPWLVLLRVARDAKPAERWSFATRAAARAFAAELREEYGPLGWLVTAKRRRA